MVPLIIILAVLQIGVIYVIVTINEESASLSRTMELSGKYVEDATSLLGGSSLLSEAATSFVLQPKTEEGDLNIEPLKGYAGELNMDRRGYQVAQRFRQYQVSQEDHQRINEAAEYAGRMMDAQLHALALIDSIYPLPDDPVLSELELPELSSKEKALSEKEKLAEARRLVLGEEYGMDKQTVSEDVNACQASIRQTMTKKTVAGNRRIGMLRTTLWFLMLCVTLLMALIFLTLYVQVFAPLGRFTRLIRKDKELDAHRGLQEVRLLAASYNELKRRRDALDGILQSAASTDTLTQLPNRYGFEQYILDVSGADCSVGVVLFDVNYLKHTNDTLGHAAGDKLLQSCAGCISDCFGVPGEENCFRFGGDEFAAVIKGGSEEEIEDRIHEFVRQQKERELSIAWGYAFAMDANEGTIRTMIDEADYRMYEQKKQMHASEK